MGKTAPVIDTSTAFTPSGVETPSPLVLLIGIIALIFVLKLVGESPNTSIEGHHIHIGAYNLATILVVVWGGTGLAKLLLNRWQIPGATTLINFI